MQPIPEQSHEATYGYEGEVKYLRSSEPLHGFQFVAQMVLLALCCLAAWVLLGLWEAAVWYTAFAALTSLEKWMISRLPNRISHSRFNTIRAILFFNAVIFDFMPIFLWFHPNEILKFGTLALVSGAILNNMNTRARYTSILVCVQIPNAIMLLAIGCGLIWIDGWTSESITAAVVSLAIVAYFSVSLREAHFKEMEIAESREAREQLKNSEKRLSTLAANFDGAIFRYRFCADGTDRIDYMSEGAESVWGLKSSEITGDPGKVWATVHPDDVAGVEQVFTQGTQNLSRIRHRWRVVRPNRSTRWIECRCVPQRLESGDTLWDGFVIDVSDAIAAREELRKKTEMLGQAQKMEVVGQIAGGIAHDFNNLLAVVLGNAELIEGARLDGDGRESLDAIVSACAKGADLTQRLLSFARRSRLAPEVVHLSETLEGMVPFLERVLPESVELKFKNEIGGHDTVDVDVTLLESSILNLVLNARDAMPAGGEILIRLLDSIDASGVSSSKTKNDAPVTSGSIVLEVRDSGVGIPDELLPRVTEPFVTSKGPELGSGLGLAMVDGFVDQSGGRLEILSDVNSGTTVRIFLPAVELNPIQKGRNLADNPEKYTLSARALLVEDEPQVRLTTSRQLRRMGVQVDAVGTGEEALDFLEQRGEDIDLLISDVVMPGQPDGVTLAQLFRKRFPEKPALLISGYANIGEVSANDEDPMTVRLMKPVGSDMLAKTIQNLLARLRQP